LFLNGGRKINNFKEFSMEFPLEFFDFEFFLIFFRNSKNPITIKIIFNFTKNIDCNFPNHKKIESIFNEEKGQNEKSIKTVLK
jgi:hypothetical protein